MHVKVHINISETYNSTSHLRKTKYLFLLLTHQTTKKSRLQAEYSRGYKYKYQSNQKG